jgi:hypothetical protein
MMTFENEYEEYLYRCALARCIDRNDIRQEVKNILITRPEYIYSVKRYALKAKKTAIEFYKWYYNSGTFGNCWEEIKSNIICNLSKFMRKGGEITEDYECNSLYPIFSFIRFVNRYIEINGAINITDYAFCIEVWMKFDHIHTYEGTIFETETNSKEIKILTTDEYNSFTKGDIFVKENKKFSVWNRPITDVIFETKTISKEPSQKYNNEVPFFAYSFIDILIIVELLNILNGKSTDLENNQPEQVPAQVTSFFLYDGTKQKQLYDELKQFDFLPQETIYSHFCHVVSRTAVPDNDAPFKPLKWLKNKQRLRELLTCEKIKGGLTITEVEQLTPLCFIDSKGECIKLAKNKAPKEPLPKEYKQLQKILATL